MKICRYSDRTERFFKKEGYGIWNNSRWLPGACVRFLGSLEVKNERTWIPAYGFEPIRGIRTKLCR